MRRFVVVAFGAAAVLVTAACAMIAGLEYPDDARVGIEGGEGSTAASDVVVPTNDALASDGGTSDADAGRTCTGAPLKLDSFADRDAAATDGWVADSNGSEGKIEVTNGQLHVRVPAATTGQNVRRHLAISKPGAKHMCVSFTVTVDKPDDTSAYFGNGDTTFGFIHAAGTDGGSYFHGVMLAQLGLFLYAQRGGANDDNRLVKVPLGTKWNVLMDADYVADRLTIAINDAVETLAPIRPSETPAATIYLGIRNFGPAPEAEAYFDDVVVTAD